MPLDVTYRTNAVLSLVPNLTTIIYEEPIDYSDFGKSINKNYSDISEKETR